MCSGWVWIWLAYAFCSFNRTKIYTQFNTFTQKISNHEVIIFPLSWQKEFTFRAKSWINVSIDLKNFLPMCGISVCSRWLCNITFCSVLIVVICKSDITVHEHVLYLEFWTLHWIVFKYHTLQGSNWVL